MSARRQVNVNYLLMVRYIEKVLNTLTISNFQKRGKSPIASINLSINLSIHLPRWNDPIYSAELCRASGEERRRLADVWDPYIQI